MRNRQRTAQRYLARSGYTAWLEYRHPTAQICAAAVPVLLLLTLSHPLALVVACCFIWLDRRNTHSKNAVSLTAWMIVPLGLYFLVQIILGAKGQTTLATPLTGEMLTLEAVVFAAANGLRWLLLVLLSLRLASLLDAESWLRFLSGRWAPLGTGVGLCLRFMPWLARDASLAYAIQRSRTATHSVAEVGSWRETIGNALVLRARFRPVQAALLTMIDTTMERAHGFAETLSLRGYGSSTITPSTLPGRRWRTPDTVLTVCSLVGTIGLLYSMWGYTYFPYLSPLLPGGHRLAIWIVSALLVCTPVVKRPVWPSFIAPRLVTSKRRYGQGVQP